ncbi:MAG: ribosomal protein S18-alanine N-acetyltransferase [Sphingomonadales bacterium]|jgi:ribosomal-protein-alanine N-acetyltransferase
MTLEKFSLGPDDSALLAHVSDLCFEDDSVEAWTEAQYLSALALPGVQARIFYQNDMPMGFWLGRKVLDEAEILLIATHREYRRKGVGRTILTDACDYYEHAGVKTLFLEVREQNLAAQKLYIHVGFQYVGRRPKYYRMGNGSYEDALNMTRKLPV